MKLLIYSVSLLSMVSLARSGCTENQYGKDGCEPDPYLCRHIHIDIFPAFDNVLCLSQFLSRIVCQKDADCVLEESDPQTPTCSDGGVTVPENYESFAEDMCKTECAKSDTEEDDTKRCRFWRFVSWTSLKVGLIFLSQGPSWNNEDLLSDDGHSMHSV